MKSISKTQILLKQNKTKHCPGKLTKLKYGLKAGINSPFYDLELETKQLFLASSVNMKLLNN